MSRNPRTRGARFPYVVQRREGSERWSELGGRNTFPEAHEWVTALASNDRRERRKAEYRIRNGQRTVFEMSITFPTVGATLTMVTTK